MNSLLLTPPMMGKCKEKRGKMGKNRMFCPDNLNLKAITTPLPSTEVGSENCLFWKSKKSQLLLVTRTWKRAWKKLQTFAFKSCLMKVWKFSVVDSAAKLLIRMLKTPFAHYCFKKVPKSYELIDNNSSVSASTHHKKWTMA